MKESSHTMNKKSYTLYAAIFVIVLLLMGVQKINTTHAAHFQDTNPPYSNRHAQAALMHIVPTTTALVYDNEQLIIEETKTLLRTNQYTPHRNASLTAYFFAQTHTAHPWGAYKIGEGVFGIGFDEKEIGSILQTFKQEVDRDAANAELVIEGNRATSFIPHQSGRTLDPKETRDKLHTILFSHQRQKNTIKPIVKESIPHITLGDLNTLGIKERIAQGKSDFSGSSASRIHNIRVGAARYDGLIIQPGDEFSFNTHLGPVTAAAGFRPELVIKPEGTIPEYGGGLCQVSTTAFRAAFFGGLDITQRKNHSYSVSYYKWIDENMEPAEGLDATIYPGAVDMKFVNDTTGAILIDTYIEGNRLYFDFYGTPDNRDVLVDGPHTYDRRPSGALKATVSRTVIKNGETNEDTFHSNYVSPNLYPRVYEYSAEPNTQDNTPEDTQTPDNETAPEQNNENQEIEQTPTT